jgi:hypothetical protein
MKNLYKTPMGLLLLVALSMPSTAFAQGIKVNGAKIIVNDATNMAINNGSLVVSSGSFTLNNNANLIQNQTGPNTSNSGNIIVKRNSSPLFRLDYTMWSSPVSGTLTLGDFSPLTTSTRFYEYNTTSNLYNAVSSTGTFSLAKGYLIRMPNTWVDYVVSPQSTPLAWTGIFSGTPNNGDINYAMSLAGTGYNAVGNPYPSTLNIVNFINANTLPIANNIDGTLYFWRKTNDAGNPMSYTTCTTAGIAGGNFHPYTDPNFMSVGQGFIVKAISTTLNFNNSMRIASNTNQFFKTKQIERNRIWLNLSNTTTPINQMMVAYMTGATQAIDQAIDGRYINDSPTALNSVINSEEFAIQGRSLPFDGTDVVPLAFKTATAGDFTIAIDHVDGLFSGSQDIFLRDNTTGTETDLKAGAYTFTATAGVDNARFSLKYQRTLGVNAQIFDENNVLVYKNKAGISIKSSTAMANVKVYDIQGRLVFEKDKLNANETTIESAKLSHQVLIVKITSADNKIVNKKIVN